MCARGRHDTSQLVTRRFTEATTFCIAKGMSRIHRLWEECQEANELGSDDDEMFLKLRKELIVQSRSPAVFYLVDRPGTKHHYRSVYAPKQGNAGT
ncbi:hypothetical protein AUP68_14746 [Ilyonectria robusta]